LRPAAKAILGPPQTAELALPNGMGNQIALAGAGQDALAMSEPAQIEVEEDPNLIEDLTSANKRTPQKRLEQIVEFNETQAATILKLWIHQGEPL
jgi:flagellar M-ring protein FliF